MQFFFRRSPSRISKMANKDTNRVAIQIDKLLAKATPLCTTECCIYRVPFQLRKLNEDAYTPKVVSIGPFHHGNPGLQNMESHKQIYCKRFIERAEKSSHELVSCVRELEPKIRLCYSENIKLSMEEFVKLILVDSVFIIELLLRKRFPALADDRDIPFICLLNENVIRFDLLLLENQIPFFILEKLYYLAFPSRQLNGNRLPSFVRLSVYYFNEPNFSSTTGVVHFTDLRRKFDLELYSGTDTPPESTNTTLELQYGASELSEAGVKFQKIEGSPCILNLRFSQGCLEIPCLEVDDNTELLFRNMMALEQCHHKEEAYITDYVTFLDLLINTEQDVDVLVKNGIIKNMLGSNADVVKLFNNLCKSIWLGDSNPDYIYICERLTAYYNHRLNWIRATLIRDYCKTPWQMAASIAGIVLLILTAIQTICSILPLV